MGKDPNNIMRPCFQFSQEEIEALRKDLEDNFPELPPTVEEMRIRFLDYLDARFYYNTR